MSCSARQLRHSRESPSTTQKMAEDRLEVLTKPFFLCVVRLMDSQRVTQIHQTGSYREGEKCRKRIIKLLLEDLC